MRKEAKGEEMTKQIGVRVYQRTGKGMFLHIGTTYFTSKQADFKPYEDENEKVIAGILLTDSELTAQRKADFEAGRTGHLTGRNEVITKTKVTLTNPHFIHGFKLDYNDFDDYLKRNGGAE